jgi:hypothetical protein
MGDTNQIQTIIYPKGRVYRVIPPARTMNVERPIAKTTGKKHIVSALYYTSEKTV